MKAADRRNNNRSRSRDRDIPSKSDSNNEKEIVLNEDDFPGRRQKQQQRQQQQPQRRPSPAPQPTQRRPSPAPQPTRNQKRPPSPAPQQTRQQRKPSPSPQRTRQQRKPSPSARQGTGSSSKSDSNQKNGQRKQQKHEQKCPETPSRERQKQPQKRQQQHQRDNEEQNQSPRKTQNPKQNKGRSKRPSGGEKRHNSNGYDSRGSGDGTDSYHDQGNSSFVAPSPLGPMEFTVEPEALGLHGSRSDSGQTEKEAPQTPTFMKMHHRQRRRSVGTAKSSETGGTSGEDTVPGSNKFGNMNDRISRMRGRNVKNKRNNQMGSNHGSASSGFDASFNSKHSATHSGTGGENFHDGVEDSDDVPVPLIDAASVSDDPSDDSDSSSEESIPIENVLEQSLQLQENAFDAKKKQLVESLVWFSHHTPRAVLEDLVAHEIKMFEGARWTRMSTLQEDSEGASSDSSDSSDSDSDFSSSDSMSSLSDHEDFYDGNFSASIVKLGKRRSKMSLAGAMFKMPKVVEREGALLFVDISGFTKLSTLLDVESLSKVINSYFDMIVSEVVNSGGDILKFAGDAFFAEWKLSEDAESTRSANPLVNLNASLSSVLEHVNDKDDDDMPKLSSAVLSACKCAAQIVNKFSDYQVSAAHSYALSTGTDNNSLNEATLNLHCGVGCGHMVGLHVGDYKEGQEEDGVELRREFLILGDPIEQVSLAADVANNGEVYASGAALKALAYCCDDMPNEYRLSTQPLCIASRDRTMFSLESKDEKNAELIFTNQEETLYEALRTHCLELNQAALGRLHLQMALYVHPVIRDDELQLSAEIRQGKVEQLRDTIESRLLAEAELRSVFTMFIKAVLTPRIVGLEEIDRPLYNKLADIMHITSRELDRYSGHLRQFIVDDKGVVIIATFGLRGSTFPNMVANNGLPATFSIHNALKTELGVENRIGATFGKVYCGVVGGVRRHEFAVMGAGVNLAARLMASKMNKGILVDEAVQAQAGTRYDFNNLPPVKAKGYDKPVAVAEPINSVGAAKKKKSLVPFVGREYERREITAAAETIVNQPGPSQSAMVFLMGECGMGKSALGLAAIEDIRKQGMDQNKKVIAARSTTSESEQRMPLSSFRKVYLSMIRDITDMDAIETDDFTTFSNSGDIVKLEKRAVPLRKRSSMSTSASFRKLLSSSDQSNRLQRSSSGSKGPNRLGSLLGDDSSESMFDDSFADPNMSLSSMNSFLSIKKRDKKRHMFTTTKGEGPVRPSYYAPEDDDNVDDTKHSGNHSANSVGSSNPRNSGSVTSDMPSLSELPPLDDMHSVGDMSNFSRANSSQASALGSALGAMPSGSNHSLLTMETSTTKSSGQSRFLTRPTHQHQPSRQRTKSDLSRHTLMADRAGLHRTGSGHSDAPAVTAMTRRASVAGTGPSGGSLGGSRNSGRGSVHDSGHSSGYGSSTLGSSTLGSSNHGSSGHSGHKRTSSGAIPRASGHNMDRRSVARRLSGKWTSTRKTMAASRHRGKSAMDADDASVDGTVAKFAGSTLAAFEKLCWACEQIDFPYEYADIVGSQFIGLDGASPVTHVDGHVPSIDDIINFLTYALIAMTEFADLIVIFVDDFQWVDSFTWKLFRELSQRGDKFLLICAMRSHDKQALRRLSTAAAGQAQLQMVEISLAPLDLLEIRSMIAKALGYGEDAVDESLCADIYQRTGGLPVFVLELLESIKRNKYVVVDDNNILRWTPEAEEEQKLISSKGAVMEETFLSRFDALDVRVRKVLQTCAVLGLAFYLSDVIRVHPELEESEIEHAMNVAVDEIILVEQFEEDEDKSVSESYGGESFSIAESFGMDSAAKSPGGPDSRSGYVGDEDRYFEFTHAMWREKVLTTMLKERKIELHRLIAEEMEKDQVLILEQSDISRLLTLFDHWKACGDFSKSAPLALAVGSRLEEWDLAGQSLELYRDALEMSFESVEAIDEKGGREDEWVQVSAHPEILDLILRLHIRIGLCHQRLGDEYESAMTFEDAYKILKTSSNIPGMSRSLMMPIISTLCSLKLERPAYDQRTRKEQAALIQIFVQEAQENGDPVHISRALSMASMYFANQGQFERALDVQEQLQLVYDVQLHSEEMVDVYGFDYAAESYSESVQWYYLMEKHDESERQAEFVIERIIPLQDPADIGNMLTLTLPVIHVFKLLERGIDADILFKKYIINAYHDYVTPEAEFWVPLFNPMAYLLEVIKMEEEEMFDPELLMEIEEWVLEDENSEFHVELERKAHTWMGEICWRLANLKDENDDSRTQLLGKAKGLLEPVCRIPHSEIFLKQLANALLEAM